MSDPLDNLLIGTLEAWLDEARARAEKAEARAEKAEADLAEALARIARLEDQDAAQAGRRTVGLDLTIEQRRGRGLVGHTVHASEADAVEGKNPLPEVTPPDA